MNANNNELSDKAGRATSDTTARASDALASANTTFMKAIDQNRAMIEHLMRAMQEESLRFVNMRFEHTSRAIERSRECQGLSGLVNLQQDWLMDIARDYAELNKRCGELFHEVAEHGAEHIHQLATNAVEEHKHARDEGRERAAA